MGKYIHPDVFDKGLEEIDNNANKLCLCSSEPTTRTEAITTYNLATATMTGTDFTLEDATNGRRCKVGAKNSVPVSTAGIVGHAALVDDNRLLTVTEVTPQQYYVGNFVNVPTHYVTINNPE